MQDSNYWADTEKYDTFKPEEPRRAPAAADAPSASPPSGFRLTSLVSWGFKLCVIGFVVLSFVRGLQGASEAEKLVESGRRESEAGNIEAAQVAFRKAVQVSTPDDEWHCVAQFELLLPTYELKDYASATVQIDSVLALEALPEEERMRAHYMKAHCCEQLGEWESLLHHAEVILANGNVLEEFAAQSLMLRGMALSALGRTEEAVGDGDKALILAKGNRDLESNIQYNRGVDHGALGMTDKELADYSAVIERGTSDTNILALALHNRALIHHEAERLDEAVADETRAFELEEIEPDTRKLVRNALAEIHCTRALKLAEAGQIEEALAADDACVNLIQKPGESRSQYLFNRGLHHLQLDHSEAAAADFSSVIEQGTPDISVLAFAHAMRGDISSQQGDTDQSIADYRAALATGFHDIDLKYNCLTSLCSYHEGRSEFEQASKLAEELCQTTDLTPQQRAAGLYLKGYYAVECGRIEDATESLTEAQKMAQQLDMTDLAKAIEEAMPKVSQSDPASRAR